MSRSVEFLAEAAAEVECVTGDYEARVAGLGLRFRHEVELACGEIATRPLLWRERPGGYRRVNLRGFPYFIAFIIRGDLVLIAAVGHTSRRPGYWMSRLP